MINHTIDIWHTNFKYANIKNDPITHLAFKIIDDTAPGNLAGSFLETLPSCEAILSHCHFEGVPFNCCQAAQFVAFEGLVCYHISVSDVGRGQSGKIKFSKF